METKRLPIASFIQRLARAMVQRRANGVPQLVADDVFVIQVFALRIRRLETGWHAFANGEQQRRPAENGFGPRANALMDGFDEFLGSEAGLGSKRKTVAPDAKPSRRDQANTWDHREGKGDGSRSLPVSGLRLLPP